MNKKQNLQKKARQQTKKICEMEKQWKICILTTVLAYERQIIRAKDIVRLMKQIRAMDMDVLFEKFYAKTTDNGAHKINGNDLLYDIFSLF